MNMRDRRVVVTGGGTGYGKGIAALLARAGANVWITGRDRQRLELAAREIGTSAICADVTRPDDWDRVFELVGDVDVLINNAGCGGKIVPLAEQDDEMIASVIATNLTGAILGAKRAARGMVARKSGAIINISSVCAIHAWPGWSVYTAAKSGLHQFSKALFTELRPYGIKVTSILPSWGRTNFNGACGIKGAAEDAELASQCISPDELAEIVLNVLVQPDHLTVPELVVQPMIQEIVPM